MNKLAPAFACLSSDCWLDLIPELDKFPCPLVGTDSKGIINLINQPAEQLTGNALTTWANRLRLCRRYGPLYPDWFLVPC